MSTLSNKANALQGMGGKLNSALRESQKAIQQNQFFLSSGNGKLAKYGFWAVAGAGIAAGITSFATAPVVASIGIGVSAGVGAIGGALERIAVEREYMRQEHQQFLVQAQDLMKGLQKAFADVKQQMQEEQRMGRPYQNADYIQYQQERNEQKLAQQQAVAQEVRIAEAPEAKVSSTMRLG